MKLQFRSIIGPGDLKTERITFRAGADLDVGDYTLLQTAYTDQTVTIEVFQTYWFPYQAVSKGDLVVLYTRAGSPRQKILEKGGLAHFFYWDLDRSIWTGDDKSAVLLYSPQWDTRSIAELTTPDAKPGRRINLDG